VIVEKESWRLTTLLLVVLSLIVFLIQRTSWAVFDTVFEVCIFHIPAVFSAALNVKFRGDAA
jgi:uncharacterized membrane protein